MSCYRDNHKTCNCDEQDPEIGSCCGVHGQRCTCLPYTDRYMILAQCFAILALLVSWIWWVTHLMNLVGMTLYLLFWCVRSSRAGLYAAVGVGIANALASVAVGIYVVLVWSLNRSCMPLFWDSNVVFEPYEDDDYFFPGYFNRYHCHWKAWAGMAFANALLWAGAASCVWRFVRTGRHAVWEGKHTACSDEDFEETAKIVDPTVAVNFLLALEDASITERDVL